MPWIIAHIIDLFTDHDIVTARAVPRVMPPLTDSLVEDFISF